MGKRRKLGKTVYDQIKALRKGFGIYGKRGHIGPKLAKLAGITANDSDELAQRKLKWMFTQAILNLPPERQNIAIVELNLNNEGVLLGIRRKNHQERGGPGRKSSSDTMDLDVIPDIIRYLRNDPPDPMPPDFY
jgi:hypothetical protein